MRWLFKLNQAAGGQPPDHLVLLQPFHSAVMHQGDRTAAQADRLSLLQQVCSREKQHRPAIDEECMPIHCRVVQPHLDSILWLHGQCILVRSDKQNF